MYAKISNNTIIDYPTNPIMDNPSVSFPSNWSGGIINDNEYVIVAYTDQPQTNIGWTIKETVPVYENGWKQSWTTEMLPIEVLKHVVSAKRYEVEVSGTVVANNKYATDRESQTKYVAVALDISQSNAETWSIKWKTSDNTFINLNASEMLSVVSAVRQHVQNCYNKEFEYYNLIDTANSSVLETTDFSAGWPING
jgi:hypothetical protein